MISRYVIHVPYERSEYGHLGVPGDPSTLRLRWMAILVHLPTVLPKPSHYSRNERLSYSTSTSMSMYTVLTKSQLDPDQVNNYLLPEALPSMISAYRLGGRRLEEVITRLDALLMVAKSCKARSCHAPWESLHPNGKIKTLKHALDSKFDSFYRNQPKVSFDSCQLGYLVEHEGPQTITPWQEEYIIDQQYMGGHWSWWT